MVPRRGELDEQRPVGPQPVACLPQETFGIGQSFGPMQHDAVEACGAQSYAATSVKGTAW